MGLPDDFTLDGSSPRMWGTRMKDAGAHLHHRFIPTHVGNSSAPGGRGAPASVHPHACGELVQVYSEFHRGDGSSPRMWGTR